MQRQLIPKRLIQTGRSLEMPLRTRAMVSSAKLSNPDFEYKFFDDQDVEVFLEQEFPEYADVVASFPYRIQKYDFFRYLAIYRLGGFYLDLDVLVAAGFSSLLEDRCVFSFEDLNVCPFLREEYGMDWAIGNYAFGAAPGHPFLKAVIDNCVRAIRDPKWAAPMLRGIPRFFRGEYLVLSTTGPLLLTRTLVENPGLQGELKILMPDDVCESTNRHKYGEYAVHLMDASWRTSHCFLIRRLADWWMALTYNKFFKQSSKLGKSRRLGKSCVSVG